MDRIRAECEFKVNKVRDQAVEAEKLHISVVNELNKLKLCTVHNSKSISSDFNDKLIPNDLI